MVVILKAISLNEKSPGKLRSEEKTKGDGIKIIPIKPLRVWEIRDRSNG